MLAPAARMDRTAPAPRVRRASILFRQLEQEHPVVGLIGYYRQVRKGLDGRCKFRCGADTESCLGRKGLRIHNRNRVAQRIDREDRAGLEIERDSVGINTDFNRSEERRVGKERKYR